MGVGQRGMGGRGRGGMQSVRVRVCMHTYMHDTHAFGGSPREPEYTTSTAAAASKTVKYE